MVNMQKIEEKIHDKLERAEAVVKEKTEQLSDQLTNRFNNYGDFFKREAAELNSMLGADFFGRPFSLLQHGGVVETSMTRDEKNIYIRCMVPGFAEKDLSVELRGGYMLIEGQLASQSDQEDYFRSSQEQFSESYYVGNRINEDEIKAECRNGVLLVTVPYTNEPDKIESKKITINKQTN